MEERVMQKFLTIAALAALATLGACGSKDESNGSVTPEESAGLNNAAEMLDASPDSLVAPEETPLGNGEAPAASEPSTSDAATNQAGNSAAY
jgi:hypothetical protein